MTDAPLSPAPPAPAPAFSPSDAVFAAFERGRVPSGLFWKVLALFTLATLLIYAPWIWLAHQDLRAGVMPFAPQYAYGGTQGALSLAGLLSWPLIAIVQTAFLRAMLPRTGKGLAHDALMVLVAFVVTTVLTYGLLLVAVIALAIVGAFAGIAVGAAAPDGAAGGALSAAVFVLIAILCVAGALAPLYLWLRLSLAPAMTVAAGRLRIFDSWRVTRGHVWGLFGAHLLRILLLLAAYFALFIASALIGFALIGPDLAPAWEALTAGEPLPPRVLATGTALIVLTLLPGCVLAVINCAMSAGIAASLLRAGGAVAPAPDSR